MENTAIPRNDYPRPQMMRGEDSWLCLNGKWEFELDLSRSGLDRRLFEKERLNGEITVPFVPESELSGVCHTDFIAAAWYKRKFDIEKPDGERILLHFGAVNYRSAVYVNSVKAGEHEGGYTPFTFDITDLCENGENTVTVYAENDVRDPLQPTGKQSERYSTHGCFYLRCTGIWQSVWLEFVPETYIKNVKFTPDVANSRVFGEVAFGGDKLPEYLRVVASFDGDTVAECEVLPGRDSVMFSLDIPDCKKWDIGQGNLYDVTLSTDSDFVVSYFGMRDIRISGNRILLNNRSVFQRLILDQGYYEGGIYTPENVDAFEKDISLAMSTGFNGARMHMKIFEPAYIAAADRAGFLLWEEYPTWGLNYEMKGAFEAVTVGWREVIERDFSSPSIICRCPFNETWSKSIDGMLSAIYYLTKSLDPSRLVIDASGYIHSEFTDIFDVHDYVQSPEDFKKHYDPLVTGEGRPFENYPEHGTYDGKKPYIVSEFGGTLWDEEQRGDAAWGYGDTPSDEEDFMNRFDGLCKVLTDNGGVCGFCYTQLTDVMQEKNGLFRFNREPKFDVGKLREAVSRKAAIEDM